MVFDVQSVIRKCEDRECTWKLDVVSMINFVNLAIQANSSVLFHCKAGKNRSPTAMAFYLVWKLRKQPHEIVREMQHRRDRIEMNMNLAVLWQWYYELTEHSECYPQFADIVSYPYSGTMWNAMVRAPWRSAYQRYG